MKVPDISGAILFLIKSSIGSHVYAEAQATTITNFFFEAAMPVRCRCDVGEIFDVGSKAVCVSENGVPQLFPSGNSKVLK
jgi:hypothetical protein